MQVTVSGEAVLVLAAIVVAILVTAIGVLLHGRAERRREAAFERTLARHSAGLGGELPVVQEPPSELCKSCEHFDLEEGQAIMASHRPWAEVMTHVPPAEMARRQSGLDADAELETPTGKRVPAKTNWTQFGACMHHSEIRWNGDTCEQFALRGTTPPEPAAAALGTGVMSEPTSRAPPARASSGSAVILSGGEAKCPDCGLVTHVYVSDGGRRRIAFHRKPGSKDECPGYGLRVEADRSVAEELVCPHCDTWQAAAPDGAGVRRICKHDGNSGCQGEPPEQPVEGAAV